jgi:pimeloyl-ACP methyl ester carboxylesterase/uncharacterized RDD family membrane protein YckC
MTGDRYVETVMGFVPGGLTQRDQIAMELRGHIAERIGNGQPIEDVLSQLGDPLTLAESYLASVPFVSAGHLSRALAKLIDCVLVGSLVVASFAGLSFIVPQRITMLLPILAVFSAVILFVAYSAISEHLFGRTVGKRLMGIQVIRESGARISLGQAILRQLPFFAQFFWIDALFALFTVRHQRAFELLTKTRAIALVLWMALLTPLVAAAQDRGIDVGPAPGRLIDVGGHRLHLYCTGTGSPTVVLEAGASSFAVDWGLVQPEIAKTTHVCAYDRAGMGWSEVGEPETAERVVRDLHKLLEAGGEKPPYILVGASRGGIYNRIYQRRYPGEVRGMVQVDPGHEDGLFTMLNGKPVTIASLTRDQVLASIPPGDPGPQPQRNPQTGPPFDRLPAPLYATRVEFERRLITMIANAKITRDLVVDVVLGDNASLSELSRASHASEHPLGDLPLIVLTRGRDSNADHLQRHASLAAQSARGRHEVITGAYHEIHLSNPDAVAQAILEVIAQSNSGKD